MTVWTRGKGPEHGHPQGRQQKIATVTSRDDPEYRYSTYVWNVSDLLKEISWLAASSLPNLSSIPSNIAAPKEKRFQLTRWPSALSLLALAYLDPVASADALTDSSMGAF